MAVEELGLEVAVEGFRAFMTKMTKMENAIGKTGKQWTGLGGIAGTATKALGTLAKVGLGAVIAGAAAAAAAVGALAVGMVKLGVEGFKLATDFQSQMAVLGIAASSAGLSFDELHDVALQVGGDITLLGVSATGAADSMTGLYKAGLTTTEIFGDLQGYMAGTAELGGALRASIDLAAASELDMVQASDLAAIALATFGGELETEAERADFVNDALNNMVQAADASVAEVSGLAAALTNVGPVAAQFGFSIEDTNNALAILSTRGIQGAEAGTALRSMFTNIMRPTEKVQEVLNELNVSLYDSEGAMLGLPEIIEQFEGALSGLTDEQRNQNIQTLAGTYGMKAFNTLIGEGVTGWDAMAQATANAMGIQEQAAIRADTYAGKMEALEGTIETLKIGIGEAFLPVAQELVTWFSEMIDEHGPQLQAIFEAIGAFMTANLPNAVAFVTQAFGMLQEVFAGAQESAGTLVSWFTENWPRIQETIQVVWDVVREIFLAIGDVLIGEVWPKLQEAFANITDVMDLWGIEWMDVLRAVFLAISTVVLGIIAVIVGLVNASAAAWKNITQGWRKMSEGFKRIIEGVITMFVAWVEFFKALIAGDWARALEMGKAYFRGFGDIIVGILQVVTGWFDLTFGTIIEMVKAWVQGIIDFALSLKERLVGGSIIPDMLTAIVEAFKEGFARVIESVKSFFQDMIDQFKSNLRALVNTVVSFAQDMYRAGENLMTGLRDGVIAKAKEAVQAVVDAIRRAIDAAKAAIGGLSPSTVFAEIGRDAMRGFAIGIAELTPVVQAQIQTAIVPPQAGMAGSTVNTVNNYNYNLTTNATTRPGGLRLEFDTMAMATR